MDEVDFSLDGLRRGQRVRVRTSMARFIDAASSKIKGDLKRICETDLGLISQCCLTKYVLKVSRQYLANLSLKINVKLGGRNTVLLDALSLIITMVSDIPTIIFRADVTHPENGEDTSPSIAVVVASQDWPEVTKYAGMVSTQAHRQEIIEDLFKTWQEPQQGTVNGGMIRELLLSFKRATGQKSLRIIFYRDGVSDGQFYHVRLEAAQYNLLLIHSSISFLYACNSTHSDAARGMKNCVISEEKQEEHAQKCKFMQPLVFSTILDDDL